MKVMDLPKSERPREKLIAKGVDNLKDKELLAILLRTGTKERNAIELADVILKKYPKQELLQLTYQDLLKIKGIDSGKATTLLASFELSKRIFAVQNTHLPIIDSVQDALNQLSELRNLKKEHFIALYMNTRNHLLYKEVISIGTVNASIVHPREVFEPALRCMSSQIIVVHNHPSGDVVPSDADCDITRRLIDAGVILGIDIIDHIIVSKQTYFSFKERNLVFS